VDHVPSYEERGTFQIKGLLMLLCVSLCTTSLPLAAQSSDDAAEKAGAHSRDRTIRNQTSFQLESDNADPPQAAVDHYMLGRRQYLAGRYREALVELKMALELDRNAPDLLYNVARVYENLGELDEAIAYYQRYLALMPLEQIEERDRTEKTIRRLQGAKHEIATTEPRPIIHDAPAEPHAGRADLAFWITGAAGVALLAGGATCGILAVRKYDAVGEFVVGTDGTLDQRKSISDDANRFALLADGLFIASGLALTSAALLFLLRDAEESKPRAGAWRFGLNVGQRQAQVSLSGQF
jgi:tetratricopeptide (TPR) repeat protein